MATINPHQKLALEMLYSSMRNGQALLVAQYLYIYLNSLTLVMKLKFILGKYSDIQLVYEILFSSVQLWEPKPGICFCQSYCK